MSVGASQQRDRSELHGTDWGCLPLLLAVGPFVIVDWALLAGVASRANMRLVGGIVSAQVSLLAVFTALSPRPLFTRTATGLTATSALCIATYAVGSEAMILAAAAFVQFFIVQGPLWAMRIFAGKQLGHPGDPRDCGRRQLQLQIRHVIALTAIAAVLAVILRSVIGTETTPSPSGVQKMPSVGALVGMATLFAVANSIVAWPLVFAWLAVQNVRSWLFLAFSAEVAIGALAPSGLGVLTGGPAGFFFLQLQVVHVLLVCLALWGLRLFGVRIVRAA